ncbi:MAG: hypothetical protein WC485_02840 [Opitutaceae bacterium]
MSKEKAKRLVFRVPGPDAPGFLKRQRKALELQRATALAQQGRDPDAALAAFDQTVEFLAEFVTEPADRAKATEALLEDVSQNDFDDMLTAIIGGPEKNLSAEPSSEA